MLSVLGKLLCRELGEQKYSMYFRYYSLFADRPSGNHTELIFRDIYGQLADKDMYTLHKMLERLLEAVTLSIKISKQYMWVWFATIITIVILIISPVSFAWTVCGIILVITGFGYKSAVFIVNRYCVVDADIILLYKTALYHKIMTNIL